jgi:hypothetical protein
MTVDFTIYRYRYTYSTMTIIFFHHISLTQGNLSAGTTSDNPVCVLTPSLHHAHGSCQKVSQ